MKEKAVRLAIVGAGPAGLMVFSKLLESKLTSFDVEIFEASESLGSGMPYSPAGARKEHITNVSADELPELSRLLDDWIKQLPEKTLEEFGINRQEFHEKKVVPRLLFGRYLNEQFMTAIEKARLAGMKVTINLNTRVIDVEARPKTQSVTVLFATDKQTDGNTNDKTNEKTNDKPGEFDIAILSTGHLWKRGRELDTVGFFDSPYPPAKLAKFFNHKVVIRGSSLTAIDAVKTMAKCNGNFSWEGKKYVYKLNDTSPNFRIELHSRDGLLPSVRVHMEEPHVDSDELISDEKIRENMRENDGFLELDFLFDQGFKLPLATKDKHFYEQVKALNIEQFVEKMMSHREDVPPFELLRREYEQSLHSIREERAIPWKEMLSSLSFAMNYPAKYLSAEDMIRLRETLMPLISVIIAFVPQGSCETLLALYDAGCLDLISDSEGGEVEVNSTGDIIYRYTDQSGNHKQEICETFVDCIGQKPFNIEDFPFQTLVKQGTISGARLKFRSRDKARKLFEKGDSRIVLDDGVYYLRVPGATITDCFQVVDKAGESSKHIYLMAVPHISGFNPDYSGLDFCEQASSRIVNDIMARIESKKATVT